MPDQPYPIAWGSISGREVHDAGGATGVGTLLIQLETALMYGSQVREPMDFIFIAVPTTKRGALERDLQSRTDSTTIGRSFN